MSRIRKNVEYYRTPSEVEADLTSPPENVAERYANANRIIGDVTLYLAPAPTGDDTTGDGTEANPWFSIDRAIEELGNKLIDNNANVTIQLLSGIYEFDATTFSEINRFDGGNVSIKGTSVTYDNDPNHYLNQTANLVEVYGNTVGERCFIYTADMAFIGGTTDMDIGDYLLFHEFDVFPLSTIQSHFLTAPCRVIDVPVAQGGSMAANTVKVEYRFYKGCFYNALGNLDTTNLVRYDTTYPSWRGLVAGSGPYGTNSRHFTIIKSVLLNNTSGNDNTHGLLLTGSILKLIEGIAFIRDKGISSTSPTPFLRDNGTNSTNLPVYFTRGLSIGTGSSVTSVSRCCSIGWTYGIITIGASTSNYGWCHVSSCHQGMQSWGGSQVGASLCWAVGCGAGIEAVTSSSMAQGTGGSYFCINGSQITHGSSYVHSANNQSYNLYNVNGYTASINSSVTLNDTLVAGSQQYDIQCEEGSIGDYSSESEFQNTSYVDHPNVYDLFKTDYSSWIDDYKYVSVGTPQRPTLV